MARKRSARKKGRQRLGAVAGVLVLLIAAFLAAAPKLGLPFDIPSLNIFSRTENVSLVQAKEKPVSVHFLDVGQGDCVLIKSGADAMLIDTGEAENGEKIISYLKRQGVERLKYLVGTHPHSDHIGAMPAILKEVPVDAVLMPKIKDSLVPTTVTYQKFLKAVASSGAKAVYAGAGKEYALGEASVQVLGPAGNYDDLNNESLVLRLSYGATSFLLTGDEEAKAEKDLLESGAALRSDVLKCGHHGSKTSTSVDFLKAVSPEIAIISCGEDNDYGHPHAQTLNRLRDAGVTLLRTDQNGTVVIGTDGKTLYSGMEKDKEAA